MHGHIQVCTKLMVLELFGEATWQQITEKCQLDEEHFLTFHFYDDTVTYALIRAACEVLDMSMERVLDVFGEYFLKYAMSNGYDKMIRTLGNDFGSFVYNLDSLHTLLAMTYKEIRPPSFGCELLSGSSLLLHYYSTRPGLYPIAMGLLRAVARDIFNSIITCDVSNRGEITLTDGSIRYFIDFSVTWRTASVGATSVDALVPSTALPVHASSVTSMTLTSMTPPAMTSLLLPLSPTTPPPGTVCKELKEANISVKSLCHIFPFHLIFDRDMRLQQCGTYVTRLLGQSMVDRHVDITEVFSLLHPRMPFIFRNICLFINAAYILEFDSTLHPSGTDSHNNSDSASSQPLLCPSSTGSRTNISSNKNTTDWQSRSLSSTLILKGQIMWLAEIDSMIFIGSPLVSSLTELQQRHLYLSDMPVYDVTRELVLLNQQRLAELEVSKKLDEATVELKKMGKLLSEEKRKTDELLFQMLPVRVANQLRDGKKVEAEKHEVVSILFSDIVTFTVIASAVQPMDVVNMLNALYSRFDKLCSSNGVYKVETIGDAYMVAGGLPDATPDHAVLVARMALGMVAAASDVSSPATGQPLQIRVGVHTGSVMAGVVGEKMPRYCLFGDTVNTASRMESHGLPGRIHCSQSFYEALQSDSNFQFESRGEISIKGKGPMTTYFLYAEVSKTSTFSLTGRRSSLNPLSSLGRRLSHILTNSPRVSQTYEQHLTLPASLPAFAASPSHGGDTNGDLHLDLDCDDQQEAGAAVTRSQQRGSVGDSGVSQNDDSRKRNQRRASLPSDNGEGAMGDFRSYRSFRATHKTSVCSLV